MGLRPVRMGVALQEFAKHAAATHAGQFAMESGMHSPLRTAEFNKHERAKGEQGQR